MPTISLGRQDTYYVDQGAGDVLLILPDTLHSSQAYKSEIDYYSERYRVISLDYPGTGMSTRQVLYEDERLLDLWDNRSDFAMHLLLELGVDNCYVMGVGFGAMSALFFAGYHARLHKFTARAVVADSFLSCYDARGLHRLLDRREHYYVRRKTSLSQQHGPDWRQVVDADTAFLRRMADHGGYEFPMHALKELRCPVLLTGTLGDPITNGIAEDYARLSSMIPDCRVYLDSLAEHPFIWKDPGSFRAVADLFLKQVSR